MKKLFSVICALTIMLSVFIVSGISAQSSAEGTIPATDTTQEISGDSATTITALPTTTSGALEVSYESGTPYLNSIYSLNENEGYLKITADTDMDLSVYTTGSADTYIRVYADSALDSLVGEDDDSAHGLNAYVHFNIAENATYYIQVSGASARLSGKFGLILHRGAATSGSEKPELLSNYNSPAYKVYNNCYSFALGYYMNPQTGEKWDINGLDPGDLAGNPVAVGDLNNASTATAAIETACKADANVYGGEFRRIDKYAQPAAGYFKVALVLNPGCDYHWYRQVEGGYWVHKLGKTDAGYYDDNGNMIYYPDTAARGVYTEFLGYYEVKAPSGYASYSFA